MPKSISFWEHPIDKLEEALSLRKQIATLQAKLSGLFGSAGAGAEEVVASVTRAVAARGPKKGRRKKGGMSPEGRARIAAAQKARWAKLKGPAASAAPAAKAAAKAKPEKKKRRSFSPEARAKMAAAAKKRWAKAKGA